MVLFEAAKFVVICYGMKITNIPIYLYPISNYIKCYIYIYSVTIYTIYSVTIYSVTKHYILYTIYSVTKEQLFIFNDPHPQTNQSLH